MNGGKTWTSIDPSSAFFPVELRPVFMSANGGAVPADLFSDSSMVSLPRHYAVVDVEHNHAFAVVTDDYNLVTNEQAYQQAKKIIKQVFQMTAMEDMACLNVTMPTTRSFCHIDLIHKKADFAPWEEDNWTAFLRITNSYNRTRRLRFELGFCRWICLNGMIFGSKSVEFSFAHTHRGVDRIERLAENLGDIRELETQLKGQLNNLRRFYVPEEMMLPTLCKAFDIRVPQDLNNKPRRINELIELREHASTLTNRYFKEIGPNGYAALNVLTDYATRPVGGIAPEAQIHGLQQKASTWMEDFIREMQQPTFSFQQYLAGHLESAAVIRALQA